jgi:hypothetical protein
MSAHENVDALFEPIGCPLLRIKGTYPTVLCCTGPGATVWVHWLPEHQRSMPCRSVSCSYCSEGVPRRPLCYLPALVLRSTGGVSGWRSYVLELPLRAGRELRDRLGQCVALRRARPCGIVDIRAVGKITAPGDRVPFDVFRTLSSLWRVQTQDQIALVDSRYTD